MHAKKLTFTYIALGSLRGNRRKYFSLALGIFLALFFVSTMLLCLFSLYKHGEARHIARVGTQDAALLDAAAIAPESLSAYARRVGSVYLPGELAANDWRVPVGQLDENAQSMLGPVCLEGRLPAAAGEIAMEASALRRLGLDAQVGDSVAFDFHPFGAEPVRVEYRLTGVLGEQSAYLCGETAASDRYTAFPAALLFPGEPVAGTPVIHRLLELAPPATAETLREVFGLGMFIKSFAYQFNAGENSYLTAVLIAIMGASLAACACLGVSNAFGASLNARLSQIGMMRALGATRRQIRAIFRREALLIAFACAPVALALACLAARLVCGGLYAPPALLAAAFLASVLLVYLASQLPLSRALRVSPMQAIRDTRILRLHKHTKIKSLRRFHAPRLIARRFQRLYAARQAGVSLLLALSFVALAGGYLELDESARLRALESPYAFSLHASAGGANSFIDQSGAGALFTWSDLSSAASLPGVTRVDAVQRAQVCLALEKITDYALQYGFGLGDYLAEGGDGRQEYLRLKDALGEASELMPAAVYTWREEWLESLRPYVLAGEIDAAALNEGREVLLFAPEGHASAYGESVAYANDMFSAGDELRYWHLRGGADALERYGGSVRIGALLSRAPGFLDGPVNVGDMITTQRGLAALGVETGAYTALGVVLRAGVDAETEALVATALEDIAMLAGAAGYVAHDEVARHNRELTQMTLTCAIALLSLFTVLVIALLNNAVTNRVRADKRTIGTLRAVGASLSAIAETYRRQIGAALCGGLLLGGALAAALVVYERVDSRSPFTLPVWLFALALCAYALLVSLACHANLRARLRAALRPGIAESIREL